MKRETKNFRTEIHPGQGVVKEEMFSHNRKPSHRQVNREFLNLRGKHNPKKKKKIMTEFAPNGNYKLRSGSHTRVCLQAASGGWMQRCRLCGQSLG